MQWMLTKKTRIKKKKKIATQRVILKLFEHNAYDIDDWWLKTLERAVIEEEWNPRRLQSFILKLLFSRSIYDVPACNIEARMYFNTT